MMASGAVPGFRLISSAAHVLRPRTRGGTSSYLGSNSLAISPSSFSAASKIASA
jgi:hypothetical protein